MDKTVVVKIDRFHDVSVVLPGIEHGARLRPKMARQAARIAVGRDSGVAVCDGELCYILYKNAHRKIVL